MRILAFLHSYPPMRMVGGELMTSRLLEVLAAAGHEVRVLCQMAQHPYLRHGVQVVPRRTNLNRSDFENVDVFISHPEIAHYVLNQLRGIPYIGLVHNMGPDNVAEMPSQWPAFFVVNSLDTQQKVAELLPDRRLLLMRPPTLREWVEPPVGQFARQFVTQINLSPAKGGDVFWQLAAENPDTPFLGVLGGHGEQIIPDSPPPNVTLLGQSPSMRLIYAMTKVLLVPSHTETYGMVGAEAMLCGIPVIATDVEGITDALGDAAIYCPVGDVVAWRDALGRLLGDSDEYEQWAARATVQGDMIQSRSSLDLAVWQAHVAALADRRVATADR